ncbi:MAG TPA: DUF4190 domain-containing protein [Blastocatellia bacterium]|nr:DUF4190 domain-containing protein [Blastocatellia bacterium]
MICTRCSADNPSEALFCFNCGQNFPAYYSVPTTPPQPMLKRRLAIAALVVGGISCFTLSFFIVGAIVGLVLGVIALMKANNKPEEYSGKGMALGGIALSGVSLVVGIGIAATVIPNIIGHSIADNEKVVFNNVRSVGSCQKSYFEKHGRYGTIEELAEEALLDAAILDNLAEEYGYNLQVNVADDFFEVIATPISYGLSGRRSFYVTTDGYVHAADKDGQPANVRDPYAGW